jgi:chromosome partitioning protein
MRRIAVINQKGGVGKTTTSVNLAAALAEQGRRVVVVDMDPQANLSLHLGIEPGSTQASIYPVLLGRMPFAEAILPTRSEMLRVVPSTIDLSGAELELAATFGRERVLRDCLEKWVEGARAEQGRDPADYVLFDCPPSLGLLSVNALAAASEVLITVQTEFMALMGMSKLVEVVELIRRRLNPELEITGILPCLYDSRLRLAREVLGEIRSYFPGQVFRLAVRSNVKLAEAPSFGQSILEYAPESNGALDYRRLALAILEQEARDPSLAGLPAARPLSSLPTTPPALPEAQSLLAEPRAEAEAEAPPLRQVVLTPAGPPAPAPAASGPGPAPASTAPQAVTPAADPRPAAARPALPRPRSSPPRADGVAAELEALGAAELPSLPPEALEVPRPRPGWPQGR